MKYSDELEAEYKLIFAGDIHMLSLLGVNPEVLDRALFELSYSGVTNEAILQATLLHDLKKKAGKSIAIMHLRSKLWQEFKNTKS